MAARSASEPGSVARSGTSARTGARALAQRARHDLDQTDELAHLAHEADAGEAFEPAQHRGEQELREAGAGGGEDAGRVLQDGEGARVEEVCQPARRVQEVNRVARGRRVDYEEIVAALGR